MSRSLGRRIGELVHGLIVVAFLLPNAAAAATAVPQWEQIFHPAANGTTSAAPIAARELADGTVLVVTQTFQTVHYNHDGTILSIQQLSLDPPDRHPKPRGRGLVDRPESGPGGIVNAHAVIDGFGRVVIAVVDQPNYFLQDAGNIETLKFDGLTGEALWPAPQIYHPTSSSAYPTDVFVDSLGDVVVTGLFSSPRHVTLKYEGETGALLWGPVIRTDLSSPLWTATSAMDLSGDIYVSVSGGTPPQSGISTVKYSGVDGSILWGPVVSTDIAFPSASAVGADGNYVVYAGADDRFVALKYDTSSGATLWGPTARILPSGAFEAAAESVSVDASGNLFLSGHYRVSPSGAQFVTDKVSGESGARLWSTAPIDAVQGYQPVQSAIAGNGDVVIAGALGASDDLRLNFWRYRGADGAGVWGPVEFGPIGQFDPAEFFVGSNARIFTTEIVAPFALGAALNSGEIDAATGTIAWGPKVATFPHVDLARFASLAAGPDGNPVVTGFSRSSLSLYQTVTLKYDRVTGTLLWGPVVYAPADTEATPAQVAVDSANDVFVLGFNQNLNPGGFQTFLTKYSGATGAVLWGPVLLDNLGAEALALDSGGNALILAGTIDMFNPSHIVVLKVAGASGAVMWGPIVFESDPSNADFADLLTLDASGNAFVVGNTLDNGVYQWLVLKCSAANGALLWGPASPSLGQPYSAAVDASGNLAVTGNGDTGTMTTFRLSGASGSTLWGPVTIPSAFGGAVATAVNGDVIASGDILHTGTLIDFVTIRYKASDGSVVWGPVLTDGVGHDSDVPFAHGLAFDASGNVVLGGTSQTIVRNDDIALVKYDGLTGATLWGPVYVGGTDNEQLAGLDVRGNSIAVGSTSAGGILTAVLDESLGIQATGPALPPASCGQAYAFPFVAQNGMPAYTWSIVSGVLPSGLTLFSSGSLSGTPVEQGTFAFTVRVQDATLAFAERGFTLVVGEDPGLNAITVTPGAACHEVLSVSGTWTSYLWLPNGETTPTIDVAPIETTSYGVAVGDGSGCVLHLSVIIPGTALQDPSCLGPSVASIAPSSGPAAGGTPVTIAGANFQPGAQVEIGGQPVGAGFVDPTQLTTDTPALSPGTLNAVVVANPDSGNAALLNGFFADFLDVPPSNIFHDSVERLFRRGVTAGCDAGTYCPDAHTTRAQMAVFLLKSLLGASYAPPAATGAIFVDVFPGVFAADWIEDLYNRGITGGCVASPLTYCPDADVTRAQMAVFLLKTRLGTNYQPPAATGTVFADVPADAFAAAWIEDLYHRGLTAGCNASPLRYCPDASVTRGEMAAFLVNTFGL